MTVREWADDDGDGDEGMQAILGLDRRQARWTLPLLDALAGYALARAGKSPAEWVAGVDRLHAEGFPAGLCNALLDMADDRDGCQDAILGWQVSAALLRGVHRLPRHPRRRPVCRTTERDARQLAAWLVEHDGEAGDRLAVRYRAFAITARAERRSRSAAFYRRVAEILEDRFAGLGPLPEPTDA